MAGVKARQDATALFEGATINVTGQRHSSILVTPSIFVHPPAGNSHPGNGQWHQSHQILIWDMCHPKCWITGTYLQSRLFSIPCSGCGWCCAVIHIEHHCETSFSNISPTPTNYTFITNRSVSSISFLKSPVSNSRYRFEPRFVVSRSHVDARQIRSCTFDTVWHRPSKDPVAVGPFNHQRPSTVTLRTKILLHHVSIQ